MLLYYRIGIVVTHTLYPRQFIQLCDIVALLVPNYYCRDTFYAIKLLWLAGGHQKVTSQPHFNIVVPNTRLRLYLYRINVGTRWLVAFDAL